MHLLVATGGAPHSAVALQLITFLFSSRHFANAVTLLTVVRHTTERATGNTILTQAAALLEPAIGRVQTRVRVGDPTEEIVSELAEGRYKLVVLGERPVHQLLTRLLGSTMLHVAEQARCSVLIAKGKIGPLTRILVCDSGVRSPSLLSYFVGQFGLLLEKGVKVTVLHVMSQIAAAPHVRGDDLLADAEALIRQHAPEGEWLANDLRLLEQEAHIHPTPKVRHGFVVDEILDEARSGDYDLVVIGSPQKQGWSGFLLDNLAKQIIAQIDRPVLLVR